MIHPYGIYIVQFKAISIAAVQDIFELVAPSDAVISIDEIYFDQYASGATDESLSMTLRRIEGSPTSGSGGASVTPQIIGAGGAPASGCTCERNNTNQLTGGTLALEQPFSVNATSRAWTKRFRGRENQIVLSPGEYFVWQMNTTPTTPLTVNAWVKFSEYGG